MAIGNQQPSDISSAYAMLSFVIQQKMSQLQTLTMVRIVDCTNNGGVDPVGTVTVQPLVNMMSGDNVAFPHGQLYKLPYVRVQGGRNAVIMDPEPGDIGLAGFCSRDISAVKNNKAALKDKGTANPGTFRQFSMADGIYIGACLSALPPTQYIVANAAGIKVLSPTAITLEAPTINLKGAVVQTDGNVSMSQALTVTSNITSHATITGDTDVKTGTISLKTHVHAGVTSGSSSTAPPT